MKSFGNLNLQQNLIQELAFEVESNFPPQPVVGRIVFVNNVLYICIDLNSGTPVWVPLTKEINTYSYVQGASASTWSINHGLNTSSPLVQVYGADGAMVIPDEVNIVDPNNLNLVFGSAITGRATIMIGTLDGNTRPNYSFTYNQTSPSTSWVIVHMLGYDPVVRIFIGNQEVQPASITFDSNNQVTVTFNTPQTGVARLI